MREAPIFAISRHRINVDGKGINTLVCFASCPLHCKYCINPQCFERKRSRLYTTKGLYDTVLIDQLYFLATNGGITFGGGEPLLRSKFICDFRELCGPLWKLNIETSLNVSQDKVERLLPIIDHWYIDIKDLNPRIYKAYTTADNEQVITNLQLIANAGYANRCTIRLPLIPDYNTEADRQLTLTQLHTLGFTSFDQFEYRIN